MATRSRGAIRSTAAHAVIDHGEGPEAHVRITWQGLTAPELYPADHPFQLYVP